MGLSNCSRFNKVTNYLVASEIDYNYEEMSTYLYVNALKSTTTESAVCLLCERKAVAPVYTFGTAVYIFNLLLFICAHAIDH